MTENDQGQVWYEILSSWRWRRWRELPRWHGLLAMRATAVVVAW